MHTRLQFLPLSLALAVLSLAIFTCRARRLRGVFPGSRSVYVNVIVNVPDKAKAEAAIKFPNLIPLLYGNNIVTFRRHENGQFEIFHTLASRSFLQPMRPRYQHFPVAAFVFKQSSLGAFPVPMENAILCVRLRTSPHAEHPQLFIWIVAHGVYSTPQLRKQLLYMRSIAGEFVDNVRRSLGVVDCRPVMTVSGLCNNQFNTRSGTTMNELLIPSQLDKRPTTAEFAALTPNVRHISHHVMKTTHKDRAANDASFFFVIYGQFIDHEIVLTPGERVDPEPHAPILDPDSKTFMPFRRAAILRYDYNVCCSADYAETKRVWDGSPFNRLTSFIDGSAVYGSNHLRVNTLRKFRYGLLITQTVDDEQFMPFNNPKQLGFTVHNEPSDHDRFLFAAGDVRANENIFLAAVHTLFVREHNRICHLLYHHLLKKGRRDLLIEPWMFATARKILSAEMQCILYNEFLPVLLGEGALPKWEKYDPSIDTRISLLHSTFAFRWGHSGIVEEFFLRARNDPDTLYSRRLRDTFFNTKEFFHFGIDNIVHTAVNTSSMRIDEQIIESLRDSLFVPPEAHKLDLAALNMQRTRDLGVPPYMTVQKWVGTGFNLDNIRDDIKPKLMEIFGTAEKIDPFIGCLAEKPVSGSLLGPLCHKINLDQFIRLRDGDRYYYENIEWPAEIADMELIQTIMSHKYTMAHLVFNNTKLDASKFDPNVSLFRTKSVLQ